MLLMNQVQVVQALILFYFLHPHGLLNFSLRTQVSIVLFGFQLVLDVHVLRTSLIHLVYYVLSELLARRLQVRSPRASFVADVLIVVLGGDLLTFLPSLSLPFMPVLYALVQCSFDMRDHSNVVVS